MTDDIKARFKETVAVVEATSTETFYIWKEWSLASRWHDPSFPPPTKVTMEQMNPGWSETIGTLDGMPVVISLFWNRIAGQVVLFWELTSQVQDYRMVEPYLDRMLEGRSVPRTNAMNFHNAMVAVREANKR